MRGQSDVFAEMEKVEKGHLVQWNGRTNPQVVMDVADSYFRVRSHQNSYYRFYPHGQYLVNEQSDTEYDVREFEIIGEVYDVDDW